MSQATKPVDSRVSTRSEGGPPLEALQTYARHKCGEQASVSGLRRLAGGASCETWAFDLQLGGETRPRHSLVLRRAFGDGGLLTTDLQREFGLLTELHALGFPVAEAHWFEPEGSVLGSAFLVTERVQGTDLRKALAARNGAMERSRLGANLTGIQASLHAVDWRTHIAHVLGEDAQTPKSPVDAWSRVFDNDRERVSSTVVAALAWLHAHLPADREQCLLHGDFKANNILFSEDDGFSVLDWEMAHIGDPLEDLAWTMLWTTEWDIVGGLLSPTDYLNAYASARGRPVDEACLQYWRVFSWMKLAAIFHQGGRYPERPVLAMLARSQPYVDMRLMRELQRAVKLEGAL